MKSVTVISSYLLVVKVPACYYNRCSTDSKKHKRAVLLNSIALCRHPSGLCAMVKCCGREDHESVAQRLGAWAGAKPRCLRSLEYKISANHPTTGPVTHVAHLQSPYDSISLTISLAFSLSPSPHPTLSCSFDLHLLIFFFS